MNKDYLTITSFDYRIHIPDEVPKSVILNSQGGNIYHATPIYDLVRLHGMNTVAEGTCQSAAFMVFTAGEKRISYPSTLFMQHGNKITGDTPKRNLEKCKETFDRAFVNNWCKRMTEISNKPYEFWKDTVSDPDKQFFWTAHELKEMGVVTQIVGED